jgi:hypothetical protein
MAHCALPLAQDARWNYDGLLSGQREITVFLLDSVPDFMRKASSMGSVLQRAISRHSSGPITADGERITAADS